MDVETIEHEPYIEQTIEMATEAGDRGDRPCGSLLVRNGEIIKKDTNRVYTDTDLALHPELSLARWADRELTFEEREEVVMYTTIEPCSMCASALASTGLGAVVYCVSGEEYWDMIDSSLPSVPDGYIPCGEVFDRLGMDIPLIESVLESEGLGAIEIYTK